MNLSSCKKRIVFTVTNDLTGDQRMQRICRSLAESGHKITLIGRLNKDSLPIEKQSFKQIRLRLFFRKGLPFYAEFNIRLFIRLIFTRFNAVCGVDLDTIIPCIMVSKLKFSKCVYDAHEYYPESPEITYRPKLKAFWEHIERFAFKQVNAVYTVSQSIAENFEQLYGRNVDVVRNLPYLETITSISKGNYLLYQGALNEGRGLEKLLVAMIHLDMPLYLAGTGDIEDKLKAIAKHLRVGHKVTFLGKLSPEKLKEVTNHALLGINLLENKGKSYYWSLGNKTFDYLQAELPSITIDFPEYRALAEKYETAILIDNLEAATIAKAVKDLAFDKFLYNLVKTNCQIAKKELCWEMEAPKLLAIYNNLFN